jgi:hypothetical protein
LLLSLCALGCYPPSYIRWILSTRVGKEAETGEEEEKEEEEEVSDLCFFPPDNAMPDMRHFKAFAQGMLLLRSHVEVGGIEVQST